MAKNIAATRITKKLLPLQPGAKKLTARYGEALIYVRYRLDPTEDRRYTTVELLGADGPPSPSRKQCNTSISAWQKTK